MKKILKNLKLDGLNEKEKAEAIVKKAQVFLESHCWKKTKNGEYKRGSTTNSMKMILYNWTICGKEVSMDEYSTIMRAKEYLEKGVYND